MDEQDKGLIGSGKEVLFGKLNLLREVLLFVEEVDGGGGLLLGVLFLLLKGELVGLGLRVTSTLKRPCT